jgi:hypothetical protein
MTQPSGASGEPFSPCETSHPLPDYPRHPDFQNPGPYGKAYPECLKGLCLKSHACKRNVQANADKDATFYIPFRKGFSAGKDSITVRSKLWHYYHLNREDFLWHYHLRSNAEPAFCA